MFSIVVPCYNCEATLEQCYQSLIGQTETDYEIILVDDGSTDHTPELCDAYGKQNGKTKVIHQPNGGLINAWKHGVLAASGDYIVFADSDDWADRELLGRLKKAVCDYTPDIITYGFRTEFENGTKTDHFYPLEKALYSTRKEIEENILPFFFTTGRMESQKVIYSRWSKAIRTSVLRAVLNQLDEKISIGEDTLTSFLVFLNADSVCNIENVILYHYMRRENTMCGNYGEEFAQKLVRTRNALCAAAEAYHFSNMDSIENYLMDNVLITIKKVLMNKKLTAKEKRETIDHIFQIQEVQTCMAQSRKYAKTYNWKHKFFIELVKMGRIQA